MGCEGRVGRMGCEEVRWPGSGGCAGVKTWAWLCGCVDAYGREEGWTQGCGGAGAAVVVGVEL